MIWKTTNGLGQEVTWYSEDEIMRDLDYKQYNAVVEQNKRFQQEIKHYRNTLNYIHNAKPEHYSTFKKMVQDLQRRANINGTSGT